MTKIIFATGNKDKLREIKEILSDCDVDIRSMKEAGINVDIVEDGKTFEDNALIKARAIAAHTDALVLADDSGLAVDALDGAPGIYSARFSGLDGDDKANNRKLLELLKDVTMEKRTARFVSVITLIFPDGKTIVCRGECEGHIMFEESGSNGFGYDPLFRPEGYEVSFGQLPAEEKNRISHRAKALILLREKLKELNG